MSTYVALLRAVNLGGRGRVAMADLRAVVAAAGHGDVATYLQSGNVVFTSDAADPVAVAADLRQRLAAEIGVDTPVMVRTGAEIADIAGRNPFLDRETDHTKLLVAFLSDEPDAAHAARLSVPAGAPEEFQQAGRQLYLHYPAGVGRSKLTAAYLEKRLGVSITARNWKTVTALAELAGQRS
ncbi:DUF1697 domain-containing protein [Saccharopolyspora sp. K220]|uniref:DUF1697 domain-containing protein n=1 Tax=Saccharopolyspora soli TaxID=2926618 RepID=UPI001F562DF6|nr:DUF1697 domain-containing protein [Saccharopolyspora soli]MCI2417204.1 DUF1697 domain-containing protein [Saccharopolyspora soli]